MKKLFALFICATLFSCKKNNPGSNLEGRWELVRIHSWLPVTNPQPAGQITSFSNGSFEQRRNDTLIYSGSYHVEKKKDCYTDRQLALVMDYGNNGTSVNYYEIKGDSLTISTSSCVTDGSASVYKKRP